MESFPPAHTHVRVNTFAEIRERAVEALGGPSQGLCQFRRGISGAFGNRAHRIHFAPSQNVHPTQVHLLGNCLCKIGTGGIPRFGEEGKIMQRNRDKRNNRFL